MNPSFFPSATEIRFPGWFHFVYFGLVIPFAVVRRRRLFQDKKTPLPNRLGHFRSGLLTIILLTVVSLAVGWAEGIVLFPAKMPSGIAVGAGLLFYGLAVGCMLPKWREAVRKRVPVVHLFMPVTATERVWWVALALLAGVGEEITWRGVQVAVLVGLTGQYWVATLASCLSFAAAHAIQGWRSVIVIACFALGFQFLVWLSDSLYVAMVVHGAYDLTAGLMYGKLGKQMGYQMDQGPSQPGSP